MSSEPEYDKTVEAQGIDPSKENFERITEGADYSGDMEITEQVTVAPSTDEEEGSPVAAPEPRTLTAWDTCDRCGHSVVALVLATKDESEMLFCTHHGRKHNDALVAQGFTLTFTEGPS